MPKLNFKIVDKGIIASRRKAFDITKAQTLRGLRGLSILVPPKGIPSNRTDEFNVPESEVDQSDIISYLGTPVFSSVTFGSLLQESDNSYLDLNGNQISFEPLRVDTAIMTVTEGKIIEKTTLQGRTGTVKEYTSTEDHQISLTMILSSSNNQYPKEDFNKLVNIANIPEQVKIVSELLQAMSVDYVVIESITVIQERGKRNEQLVEMTMISDDAPESLV